MKAVKTPGVLAIILAVSATAFGVFLNGSSGAVYQVLSIGSNGLRIAGGLFIVLGLTFLYQFLR